MRRKKAVNESICVKLEHDCSSLTVTSLDGPHHDTVGDSSRTELDFVDTASRIQRLSIRRKGFEHLLKEDGADMLRRL